MVEHRNSNRNHNSRCWSRLQLRFDRAIFSGNNHHLIANWSNRSCRLNHKNPSTRIKLQNSTDKSQSQSKRISWTHLLFPFTTTTTTTGNPFEEQSDSLSRVWAREVWGRACASNKIKAKSNLSWFDYRKSRSERVHQQRVKSKWIAHWLNSFRTFRSCVSAESWTSCSISSLHSDWSTRSSTTNSPKSSNRKW